MANDDFKLLEPKQNNKSIKIILGSTIIFLIIISLIIAFFGWPGSKKNVVDNQLNTSKNNVSHSSSSKNIFSDVDNPSKKPPEYDFDESSSEEKEEDLIIVPSDTDIHIDKYYIEANIQTNGDLEMKELIIIEGEYHSIKQVLSFSNIYPKKFTGILDDFKGSNIYDGQRIDDVKIYGVKYSTKYYELINNENREEFKELTYAKLGQYGIFVKTPQKQEYEIFLPSSYNQACLITYTIKDVVVIHNDIAEINWRFINGKINQQINELIIKINLPSDSSYLKAFSKFPYNNASKIISTEQVELKVKDYQPGYNLESRVVFNKNLIPNSTKLSHVNGLDNILTVEEEKVN